MSSWVKKTPKRGDHIRVLSKRIVYYHHGVFISRNEVIHFTTDENAGILDWSKAKVVSTNLEKFLDGGEVEVREYSGKDLEKLYPVEEIVEYARDCVGDMGYNPIFENCEHFANECTIGEHRSKQAERAINVVKFGLNVIGGKAMGLFSTLASLLGGFLGSSSNSGRRPSKTEKVKLAEIERDKQIKLAEIEGNKALKLAEKETARAKIESDTKTKLAELEIERMKAEQAAQIELIQEQTRSRMAQAAQKAKLAEIENELQLRLIDKDNERIGLMREAQIDIIKAQTMSQIMIEKARAEGMTAFAERLAALQEKMINLSNRRLAIIAECSMPINRELENFYGEIVSSILARREEYISKKLPPLLAMLAQYKEGSPQYNLFYRQIEKDQDMEETFLTLQMNAALQRQKATSESFNRSREAIEHNVNELAQIVATGYLKAGIAGILANEQESPQAIAAPEEKKLLEGQKSLPTREIKLLPPAE